MIKIPLLVLPVLLAQVGTVGIFASWAIGTLIAVLIGLGFLRRLGWGYSATFIGMTGQVRAMLSSLVGNYFINLGSSAPMNLLLLIRRSAR